jgi:diguanylate cyclase (GGDEF)-like protein
VSKPSRRLTVAEATAVEARVQSHIDAGAIDAALSLAHDALTESTDEPRAILQRIVAVALTTAGKPVDAIRAAAGARDGFRRAGRRSGELDALLALAGVLRASGDCASAIETLEEAETIGRELEDASRIGLVLRHIGICCSLIGRHQQALSHLLEAEAIHAASGHPRDHLNSRLSLYNAHNRHALTLDPTSPARIEGLVEHLGQWRMLADDAATQKATRLELMALGNHAITLHDVGRHREALDALVALLPRYREAAMAPNEAICHFEMGRALEALAEFDSARTHYREACDRFERIGSSAELRDALEGLANVEEALGDHRAALAALRRVRAIEGELKEAEAHRQAALRDLRIELARLGNQWRQLAVVDPLTGLANRRGLEQWFADTQPRVDAGDVRIVLLHDLDHFKSINDRFGHSVGDEVLRQVARLIAAQCRADDLAVRYGGEEFLLSMLAVEPTTAVDVGNRLRASIEAHDWRSVATELSVTVSVGIANSMEAGDAPALLTLADRRLYAAKHAGRNRVVHVD